MWLKILTILTIVSAFDFTQHCGIEKTLYVLRRSTYEFSVKLLDRVLQDTDGHFVFSPLSTWMQLATLAEGARGQTLQEIWKIAKQHRRLCLKRRWRKLINAMDSKLKYELKLKNLIIIDKLLDVKHKFLNEAEVLNYVDVFLYNFNNQNKSATEVNRFIKSVTSGKISDVLFPVDFNSTVMLTVDAVYYKSVWKFPFNPSYTERKQFHTAKGVNFGSVKMMKQLGYYNITEIPVINSKVLELPCGSGDRTSMLIFLPNDDQTIWGLFYALRRVKLLTIFKSFYREGPKLVNVELPRFKITTDLDNIPELLFDMGAKTMFNPDKADFSGISDYKMFTSLMTQVSDIEVTEEGVRAEALAENLILDGKTLDFVANKPFAFMLVDKKLEIILFAGVYTEPSLY